MNESTGTDAFGRCLRCGGDTTTGGCPQCNTQQTYIYQTPPTMNAADNRFTLCLNCAIERAAREKAERDRDEARALVADAYRRGFEAGQTY